MSEIPLGEPDDKVLSDLEALGKEVLSSKILTPGERPEPIQLPPLSYDLRVIMGMSAERCSAIAAVFRQASHPDLSHDVEEEQAFVIHLLTNMYLRSPHGWREELSREVDLLKRKLAEPPSEQAGGLKTM